MPAILVRLFFSIKFCRNAILACISLAVCSVWPTTAVFGQSSLEVSNIAENIDGTWEWIAYVSGPQAEIDRIECVVYTLHPTFPNPVQEVCETKDPKYPFGLTARGWGTFTLLINIEFKDGSSEELVHTLEF
jgi:transcription initiation factor IIF auxiliary subunit